MRNAVEATDQLRTFPVGDAYAFTKSFLDPSRTGCQGKSFDYRTKWSLLSLPFGVLVVEPPGHFSRAYYSEVAWMGSVKGLR